MVKIILASASPRRREILKTAAIPFEVAVSDAEERTEETEPARVVEDLSSRKCRNVLEKQTGHVIVIGADTIVALDGKILGKPHSRENAAEMLHSLQGRSHHVYTGVTVAEAKSGAAVRRETFHCETEVLIYPMTQEEIARYIDTGEPMDKAGAYGIQGIFSRYVREIRGDYNNVVGLPVSALYHVLSSWNIFRQEDAAKNISNANGQRG